MILRGLKKKELGKHLAHFKTSKQPKRPAMSKEESNARVAAVLAQLSGKDYTVLAKIRSESNDQKVYEIRMGSNNAVYCECKGWQYSKNGTCKHIERFRAEHKPIVHGWK